MAGDPRPGGTRREEYAEATRQAILEAARRLFRERGYFATKVDEIAAMARVAPATVYAVAGGKQGLLRTLMDLSTTHPLVAATVESIEGMDDPSAIIRDRCRALPANAGGFRRHHAGDDRDRPP